MSQPLFVDRSVIFCRWFEVVKFNLTLNTALAFRKMNLLPRWLYGVSLYKIKQRQDL